MAFLDEITAVVVNYNSGQIIDNCLRRVGTLKETIVVDNASQDNSLAAIERDYPKAIIVRNDQNLGFGGGVNRGLEKVTTPYLLTISPDAEVEIDVLQKMYEAIEGDPQMAVVNPALEVPGRGDEMWVMGPGEMNHRSADFTAEGAFCTWFSSAAVALYRTEALRKINGFDENIFLYNEDLDLSLRFTEAKFTMVTLPDVTARHINSGSAQPSVKLHWRKSWNFSWGHMYVIRKHVGRFPAVAQALKIIVTKAPKALLYILTFDRKRMVRDGGTTMGAVSFLLGRSPNPRD